MLRTNVASALLCTGLLITVLAPFAAAQETAPEPYTTVEGITEYRLDNGLRVLLFPIPPSRSSRST